MNCTNKGVASLVALGNDEVAGGGGAQVGAGRTASSKGKETGGCPDSVVQMKTNITDGIVGDQHCLGRPWNLAEKPVACGTGFWPGISSPVARRLGGGPGPNAACAGWGLRTQRWGVGGTLGQRLSTPTDAPACPPPFTTTGDTQSPNSTSAVRRSKGGQGGLLFALSPSRPPTPVPPCGLPLSFDPEGWACGNSRPDQRPDDPDIRVG